MHPIFHLSLNPAVNLREDGGDLLIEGQDMATRLSAPGPSTRALLAALTVGGKTMEELCTPAAPDDPAAAHLPGILSGLAERGLLVSTLTGDGERPLAELQPLSRQFRFAELPAAGSFRLSRFALLRRDGENTVVETPLGHARVAVFDGRLAALVGLLSRPATAADLAGVLPGVDEPVAAAFLSFLVGAKAAVPCASDGTPEEETGEALRQWEFHDLLFHSYSRGGRHGGAVGATMRFKGDISPLPAIKPPMSDRRLPLFKPDLAALAETDVPFSRVSESRRSIRSPGGRPLTLDQLGEFLFRTARIQQFLPAQPEKGLHYEASLRPCCSGGAVHPLELYLSVDRVEGLDPGFYHYDPARHELEYLSEPTGNTLRLLRESSLAMAETETADVQITLAARVPRVSWKYSSIAYALILKDLGAMFQQMYLVATAQGLAPCAIGTGNSDLFAAASGLDGFEETAVGEFVLSGGS